MSLSFLPTHQYPFYLIFPLPTKSTPSTLPTYSTPSPFLHNQLPSLSPYSNHSPFPTYLLFPLPIPNETIPFTSYNFFPPPPFYLFYPLTLPTYSTLYPFLHLSINTEVIISNTSTILNLRLIH